MPRTIEPIGAAPPRIPRALRGHSGVCLTLIEEPGGSYVRKSATRPAQNERLRRQCQKLQAAHDAGVSCPAVYRLGDNGGLFYFEMEYIPGEGLSHAIASRRELRWNELTPSLVALLERFKATEAGGIPEEEFRAKLSRIVDESRHNPAVAESHAAAETLAERLLRMSWSGIPRSDCHGDMTLENILIRQDGSLCFLDFDVPEHPSWVLDLAKVYQDLMGQWCLRELAIQQPDSTELLNAQMALARLTRTIGPAFDTVLPKHQQRMAQLASFHLMRTLPYAASPNTAAYVVKRIAAILSDS